MYIDKEILVLIAALIMVAIIGYVKARIIKSEILKEMQDNDKAANYAKIRRDQILKDSHNQWRPKA